MNYNIIVLASVLICAIMSYLVSYYLTYLFLDESSGLFKIVQLVIAVLSMTTFYSSIKYVLLKYTGIEELKDEEK